ncbi:MAG: 5,6-dimethylbenzimidazole synthase, partial [Pseudomonadota bacterium]
IYKVIRERRDMRHFTPDPIDGQVLEKLMTAAQQAPSVGYMQPWRFIRITSPELRAGIYDMVASEIEETAQHVGEKKEAYMKLKLEGINECAELWVAALMEGREEYVLGRRTMPEMDLASLSCAIQNVWLAARAEGIGMGWVSFFEPDQLAQLLEMPNDSYPAAVLCIGHVDSFYPEPLLKTEGWDKEKQLSDILFENTWGTHCNLA